MKDLSDLLAAPDDASADLALSAYARRVGDAYGARLEGIHLFGSRAKSRHRPDSDADLAVVLTSFDGTELDEKMRLVDLGFDALTDRGLMIQPWPFTSNQWHAREPRGRFASLLAVARSDGRPLAVPR